MRHASAELALRQGRCRVYAIDVPAATGMELHGAYTPCGWLDNQFAADEWLHGLTKRAPRHPWLVSDPAAADVVVMTGHGFSRWCVASSILRNRHAEEHTTWKSNELTRSGDMCGNETFEACGAPHGSACKAAGRLFRSEVAKRKLWEQMHAVADRLNTTAPRVAVYLNNECPHASVGASRRKGSTLMLVDYVRQPQDLVVPFVLSRPAWLRGDAPLPADLAPARFPWSTRKLLLYAGHVPKLYLSSTRYHLWRAWRRETARVSIYTKDIACSLSAYAICRVPSRWATEHTTFCQRDCGTARVCKANAESLRHECRSYAKVDWDEELRDVPATNRQLSRAAYLRAAMSHRFCVIAPGDFPSTPKITEFIAIGAAGGCLPVIFVPSPIRANAVRQLPYAATWLDYCELGFLAPETAAADESEMRALLDRLERVSEAEVESRRAALVRVRDAFVQRPPPTAGGVPAAPSAADFLLHEACAAARRSLSVSSSSSRGSGSAQLPFRLSRKESKGIAHATVDDSLFARCVIAGDPKGAHLGARSSRRKPGRFKS